MTTAISLSSVFGDVKSRKEVMCEIKADPVTYSMFLNLNQEFQEKFIEFCMGVRGVVMTYDVFFKYVFDAEVHPERLSSMLSQIIGRPLKVKRTLGNEHRRISEKGSLLIMDLLVEFETGEMADVEIQKVGYLFPGERASCYASDMVMRQYEKEKHIRGEEFNYKDMKKVYTIVFMENSSREFKKLPNTYIHRGRCRFDSGLVLNLLQEFYFIPLDIFFRLEDNKKKRSVGNELEAWLYFIGSDKPEHICKVIRSYPQFEELYRDIGYFRHHPREAAEMFSEALRILDENTVKYMIEEFKAEIDEKNNVIQEKNSIIEEKDGMIQELQKQLEEFKKRFKC